MTNELIHDVEETLKQERIEKIWKEYGPYIIGGVVLAVLLTAILSGWRSYNDSVNRTQTAQFIEALESEAPAASLEKTAGGMRAGHRALAWMSEAGVLLQAGKEEEAMAVYKKAAADKNLPPLFHDLAVLMAVRMEWAKSMDAKENPGAQAYLERLQPMIRDENSPWTWHARVQAAIIAAQGTEDYMLAHTHLAAVQRAGNNIPPSLFERARALDRVYSIRAAAQEKTGSAPEEKDKPEG
ncbi:MAG: hypothetical protein HY370_00180 [Proteobacteria bacterium]|nr:hypothetical protein [Pseudomonadota bacterium]